MVHPGPRRVARAEAVRCHLRPLAGVLPAGQTVMAAVGALFAGAGCRGGVLYLDGALCDPIRFVLPALATDGLHAAWYSDTHAPDGRWRILRATASVGIRDGAAFLHCHGLWQAEDGGSTQMGHLLPFDSVLAEDAHVTGFASPDGWFEARPDPETAFTLFEPAGTGNGPALIARILPGEDAITAIEALCAAHGIRDARLHGIGSIDHIAFSDGRRMDCLATELRLDGAVLRGGCALVPIEVVDIHGAIASGAIGRGGNPVGVTLELVIEPQD